MDVVGHAGNSARRNAALGNPVALVSPLGSKSCGRPVGRGDHLAAIDWQVEVEILWVHTEPTFREQQIAKHDTGALEAVDDVEYLGDDLEAIADVKRGGDHSGVITKSGPEHLPEVALLGFGGNTRGRAGPLAVDHYHRGFGHG